MTKRRLVALLEGRLARRLIISPIIIVMFIVGLILSPLLLGAAMLVDFAKGQRRLPRLRLGCLLLGALALEVAGMAVSFGAWIVTGFGQLGSPRWRWHVHRGYMGLYTNAMFGLIRRVVGAPVEWRDHADLSAGPVVMLARHTSFFDALIPATVLSRRNKLLAHHIVTQGLRYAPCIDIVGHRFPNRFIKRTPGAGSNELVPIQEIGSLLDERSAAIIFPEGTFRNPERFERVVRRIRRRQPELAQRAQELQHVLPPRSNGTFALLQGAPAADVVICANTGLESFGTIKQIIDAPYTDAAIIIETWRIARADIPQDPDEFDEWLFDQYVVIDDWVESVRHS